MSVKVTAKEDLMVAAVAVMMRGHIGVQLGEKVVTLTTA